MKRKENVMENFKHIFKNNYNNKVDEDADNIYYWMNNNKENLFVQNLGNIWLKKLIRSSRERFLFR